MEIAYKVLDVFVGITIPVMFVILFYLSIRKCFNKEKKKGFSLFVVCFFTNPFITFVVVSFLEGLIYALIFINNSEMLHKISSESVASAPLYTATIVFTWMLEMLFGWIVSRWLKVRHPSLVFFIYQMYCVVFMLSIKSIDKEIFGESYLPMIGIELVEFLLSVAYLLLLYFLVIKALAGLTERPFKSSWRIFIIPPSLFSLLYGTVVITLYFFLDGTAMITIYAFSTLVSYLFLWTFYIIIKNITATGDALEARDEVKTLSVEVMEALAHTIDAKDEYTKGHSVRVAKYSRMLAQTMGLSEEECENVYYMGLLHDIGKIGVPNEIINSPTKLTDEQFGEIKKHPGLGYDILAEIKSRPDLCIGARWHHERYDGTGYPDGKAGEEIPLPARIISVADSYDAMTYNRSYRRYLAQERVRRELKSNEGTQFDPIIAEAMCTIIDEDKEYKLHE